jgi:hypothetical protein
MDGNGVARSTLTIGRRFNGPKDSGNGGYVAGRLAALIGGTAEITLRAPPPLDRPLDLVKKGEAIELKDGETLLAVARPATLASRSNCVRIEALLSNSPELPPLTRGNAKKKCTMACRCSEKRRRVSQGRFPLGAVDASIEGATATNDTSVR